MREAVTSLHLPAGSVVGRGGRNAHGRSNAQLSAFYDAEIGAAVAVAIEREQRAGNGEVARGGLGVHVGGGAADDPIDPLEDHIAGDDALADKVELCPGGQALDMDVAAEAERVDLGPDLRPEIADGLEV